MGRYRARHGEDLQTRSKWPFINETCRRTVNYRDHGVCLRLNLKWQHTLTAVLGSFSRLHLLHFLKLPAETSQPMSTHSSRDWRFNWASGSHARTYTHTHTRTRTHAHKHKHTRTRTQTDFEDFKVTHTLYHRHQTVPLKNVLET